MVLENQMLKVVVLSGKGTDIYEFRDKSSDTDLLCKSRWGVTDPRTYIQDTPEPEAPFRDFYHGGWQELFPNAGNNCRYKGAELGFHGEVCKVPWEYRITETSPQRVSVKFLVRTVRTPFRLEKTLSLESDQPALRIEETVTNEGSEKMDFMWGHHPAFGPPFLSEDCQLFASATAVETGPPLPAEQILKPDTRFDSFPIIQREDGGDYDLSRTLPSTEGITNLTYLTELTGGWYCFVNNKTKLGFSLCWNHEVFRHIWLWQEFCGTPHYPWWGRAYIVGIEPHSSIPGLGLNRAIERGTQLTLEPDSSLSTTLIAALFEARGEPKGVDNDGCVTY